MSKGKDFHPTSSSTKRGGEGEETTDAGSLLIGAKSKRAVTTSIRTILPTRDAAKKVLPPPPRMTTSTTAARRRRMGSVEDVTSSSSSSSLSDSSSHELQDKLLLAEEKLRNCSKELDLARKHLTSRDMEVDALQRRLQDSNSNNGSSGSGDCQECNKKDVVIVELYDTLEQLQISEDLMTTRRDAEKKTKIRSSSSSSTPELDLDQIFQNISDLNILMSENRQEVAMSSSGSGFGAASFRKQPIVSISFYSNGFHLDTQLRFRPYEEAASRAFLKDLKDGFFPAELQGEHPDGITFLVCDRRHEKGPAVFVGKGRRLTEKEEDTKSSSSSSLLLLPLSSHSSRSITPILAPISSGGGARKGVTASQQKRPTINDPVPKKVKLPLLKPIAESSSSKVVSSCGKNSKVSSKGNGGQQLRSYAPFAPSNFHSRKDASHLKVMGAGEATFLLQLVAYDTVKTLKGIVRNHLSATAKAAANKGQGGSSSSSSSSSSFEILLSFPPRKMNDESLTLGDLGLVPNGVIHVCVSRRGE